MYITQQYLGLWSQTAVTNLLTVIHALNHIRKNNTMFCFSPPEQA